MADNAPGIAQNPTQIAALIIVVGIIGGALFYFLYYSDLDTQLIKLRNAETKQQGDLQKLREDHKKMEKTILRVACFREEISKTERQLPNKTEDLDLFVNSLNDAAKAHDIKISVLRRLENEEGELFRRAPFELVFYANFNDIADFFWKISELETRNGEQIVNVMNFSLTRLFKQSAHPEKMIKVSALVETYLYSAVLLAEESSQGKE